MLPSFRDRMALTFWISGRYRVGALNNADGDSSALCGVNDAPATASAAQMPLSIPRSLSAPFSLPQTHWDSRCVFVSIASYCDSECGRTVQELFRTASVPSRVFVGVVWQGETTGRWDWEDARAEGEEAAAAAGSSSSGGAGGMSAASTDSVNFACHRAGSSGCALLAEALAALRTNVRMVAMAASQANGPCFARHLAGALWRGEDYVLQIDSHMRFRPNWDQYLIWQLESMREQQQQSQQQASVKPILTTYPLGYRLPNTLPDDIRPTLLVRVCHVPFGTAL